MFSLEIESEVEVDCGNGNLQQVNRLNVGERLFVHEERPRIETDPRGALR